MNDHKAITYALWTLAAVRLAAPAMAEFQDVYFVQVPPQEVGTPIGYQTWRAVARFTEETDYALSVHGVSGGTALEFHTDDPAGLKNLDPGEFFHGLHQEDFPTFPICAAWDSFVTIGAVELAGSDAETSPGFLGGGPGNLIKGTDFVELESQGWYDADPGDVWTAGAALEVVIAQFTVGVGFSVELGGVIDGEHTFGASPVAVPFSEAFYAVGEPAGDPGWNRRIRAITTTPDPADPGRRLISATFQVEAQDISAPIDLSTLLLVRVNGAVAQIMTVDVTASPTDGGGGPCGGDCLLGEVCYCHGFPPECECGYWIGTATTDPINLQPGDEIMVFLRPAPDTAPETDTSDDELSLTYLGDQLYWNRKIDSVDVEPTAGAPDNFFDITVDVSVDANYDGVLELGAELDLFVNGARVGSFPTNIDDVLGWNQCASVACDDSVACVMDPEGNYWGTCQEDEDGPLSCSCQYHPVPGPPVIPAVQLLPDDEIVIILRPVPGALPELPGFDEDDIDQIALPRLCPGDIDADGQVGFGDLLGILATWGPCAGCPEDLDGNNVVDFGDLLIVLSTWGPCP